MSCLSVLEIADNNMKLQYQSFYRIIFRDVLIQLSCSIYQPSIEEMLPHFMYYKLIVYIMNSLFIVSLLFFGCILVYLRCND